MSSRLVESGLFSQRCMSNPTKALAIEDLYLKILLNCTDFERIFKYHLYLKYQEKFSLGNTELHSHLYENLYEFLSFIMNSFAVEQNLR